ncbi:MAG: elongation factor G [bacterium]
MKKYETQQIRNIALLGHGHAGKTSLNEVILFDNKIINRLGNIKDGNTVSDYHEDEIDRGISIYLSYSFCEWNNAKINIIDTPGYADFVGDVHSALKAVETGLIVVDAVSDLEVGAQKAWDLCTSEKIAKAVFVNKMDKQHADFEKVCQKMKDAFGVNVIPVFIPIGVSESFQGVVDLIKMKAFTFAQGTCKEEAVPADLESKAKSAREELMEAIASIDDTLTEKYLDGGQLTEDEIKQGLKKGIKEQKVVPVFCGSSTANVGIQPFLDAIVDYFPSPLDIDRGKVKGEDKFIKADSKAAFSALVFKTMTESHMGEMAFFRVFSGKISSGNDVQNVNKRQNERLGQIAFMEGKERKEVSEVESGDIATVVKLKHTATGDTLCSGKSQTIIEPVEFPRALIDMALYAKSKAEAEKVGNAVNSMVHSDPTLHFYTNKETKEAIISGMGNLQIEVVVSRLKKLGLEVELRKPKVAYKETIHGKAEVQGKYKKQSGGKGQYGDVWIKIEPMERGKGFEFVNKVVGGAIPRNYIPAVEKGVKETMERGILAGCEVVDLKVTLFDGSYHDVDSSDMAFKIAGSMALKKAVVEAKPCLLEPIMNVEVYIPEDFMGAIMGDLNSRRGRVLGMERKGKVHVVKAQVPLGELYKYSTDLRSLTHGWGGYKMDFSHYEDTPPMITQTIIDDYNKKKEEEAK